MASKKCPMCGTMNDQNAQSCKYCGYLFENLSSPGVKTSSSSSYFPSAQEKEQQPPSNSNIFPPPSASDTFGIPQSSTTFTGSPLFVVSRSLLASIAPAIIYLVFISSFTSITNFDPFSIVLLAVFILVAILPVLFTPRKYEFHDGLLRIHKIIGGDSEFSYSDMAIYDYSIGRRPRILLSVAGRRGPLVIPGNPMNKELGEDLNQFLSKKLKKYTPQSGNQQQSAGSSDTDAEMNADADVDATKV